MRSAIRGRSRSATLALLAVVVGTVVAACGGSGNNTTTSPSAPVNNAVASEWSLPNGNLYDNRTVDSKIDSSTISRLKVAWTLPISGHALFGVFASTPVFSNGVVYLQDLANNVYAVNESNGQLEWEYKVPAADSNGEGPNGVAVVNGVVYGETNHDAFAIQATTGEQLWRTPNLADKTGQGFNIAPIVVNGVEYLSTSGQADGGEALALNADTGKVIWKFQETKQEDERNAGGKLGTGGAWGTPLVIGGSVYFGVANPYRSINDARHPDTRTQLLYNNSTISLNAKTGKLQWYYQAVPNDFHDWDMEVGPLYVPEGGGGSPTVIDAGKMGFVYAYNASNGKLEWKTSVGHHNGTDNDSRLALQGRWPQPKLPYVFCPGIYGGVESQMAENDGTVYVPVNNLCSEFKSSSAPIGSPAGSLNTATGEMVALNAKTGQVEWDKKFPHSAYGAATVTNNLVFTTTFDGKVIALNKGSGEEVWSAQLPAGTNSPLAINGDMLIAAASFAGGAGQKEEIVAYSLNAPSHPTTGTAPAATTSPAATSPAAPSQSGATSLVGGAKVFVTNCAACHTLSEVGATGTVGPNLDQLKPADTTVQHQVTNGGGGMPAFGSILKKPQIDAVAHFVATVAGTGRKIPGVHAPPPAG